MPVCSGKLCDNYNLSPTIKKDEFTMWLIRIIVTATGTKEVQVMYSIGTRKQNSIMCCRMLYSRALNVARCFDSLRCF